MLYACMCLKSAPYKIYFLTAEVQMNNHFTNFQVSPCYTFQKGNFHIFHQIFLKCQQLLSRVQLFATSWTVPPPCSSVHEFSRQEHYSGLPFPSPGDFPDRPRDQTQISCTAGRFFDQLSHQERAGIYFIHSNSIQ